MAKAHHDAGSRKCRDLLRRDRFWRSGRKQGRQVAYSPRSSSCKVVSPIGRISFGSCAPCVRDGEVRAFEMQSGEAGAPSARRFDAGGDRGRRAPPACR